MCLSTVNLNLEYSKSDKCFVGTGYKGCEEELIEGGKLMWSRLPSYYTKKWVDASLRPKVTVDYMAPVQLTRLEDAYDSSSYYPGFHIWLNPEDAMHYLGSNYALEVKFKEVTSFGTNSCVGSPKSCVVARFLKVVKLVTKTHTGV